MKILIFELIKRHFVLDDNVILLVISIE